MNELELIEKIKPLLPTNEFIIVGAGDDCAVLKTESPDLWMLFKTDAVVEGVHFTCETPPEKVGHKALGRCMSDVAAMGGRPTVALVTIGLPNKFSASYVQSIYMGISNLARKYAVAIAGGETTTCPERIFISVSLLGVVEKENCVFRTGARVGDAIFVTGELGGSIEGKHLDFEPRINEASWLVRNFKPTAMIDISDGLATDLRHITVDHGLGAEILATAIPISQSAKRRAHLHTSAKPALTAALTDGEDFELLFTIPPSSAVKLVDSWRAQYPTLKLSCIGKVLPEKVFKIRTKNGIFDVTEHGYIHFQ